MRILNILVFFLLINSTSLALETKRILDHDEWAKKSLTLDWKNFEEEQEYRTNIEGVNASIKINKEDFYLINKEDMNQYSYWTWGTPTGGWDLLLRSKGYMLFIETNDDGYVNIEDWNNVDTDRWIKILNENAQEELEKNEGKDIDLATKFTWVKKPKLDRKKNMVFYAYEVLWNDGVTSLESRTLILGKNGYSSLVFTTTDEETPYSQLANKFSNKAETFKFNEGSTYSEYKTGDKIAAVGIGALLATTLGVKALSPGLLATLGKLLAKFWFILLLPFIFIGKLIDSLKTKRKRR